MSEACKSQIKYGTHALSFNLSDKISYALHIIWTEKSIWTCVVVFPLGNSNDDSFLGGEDDNNEDADLYTQIKPNSYFLNLKFIKQTLIK